MSMKKGTGSLSKALHVPQPPGQQTPALTSCLGKKHGNTEQMLNANHRLVTPPGSCTLS